MTLALRVLAAVLGVSSLAAAPALAEHPRARLVAADQAAARAALLRKAELPNTGWEGGEQRPDLAREAGCPGFRPKQADLVVTGAADTLIHHTGIELYMSSRVFRSQRMAALDWRRSVEAAGATPCVRTRMTAALPSPTVVSFRVDRLPHVAPRQRWFRLVADLTVSPGARQRVGYDMLLLGSGRTSLNLTMVYVFGMASDDVHEQLRARTAELQLARAMVDRVSA